MSRRPEGASHDESDLRARGSSQRSHRSPRHTFFTGSVAPSGAGVSPGNDQRRGFSRRSGGRAPAATETSQDLPLLPEDPVLTAQTA